MFNKILVILNVFVVWIIVFIFLGFCILFNNSYFFEKFGVFLVVNVIIVKIFCGVGRFDIVFMILFEIRKVEIFLFVVS